MQKKYYHDLLNDAFYNEIVFRNKENGYFVEIGALDGVIFSQSHFFEKEKNWNGIIVEPNTNWHSKLKEYRGCNIETSPISDEERETTFVITENPGFSHLESFGEKIPNGIDVQKKIKVKTTTLLNLLKKYKSPKEIDWVSIDVEGHELSILDSFFKKNKKYRVNLFAIEYSPINEIDDFFKDKPYLKIENPFLRFLKTIPIEYGSGIFLLNEDASFKNIYPEKTDFSFDKLIDINWEHYYVHIDFLKENLFLKNYILKQN